MRACGPEGLRAPLAWQPSATSDCCAGVVLATVPGNSARASGDRHERQIARFARTTRLPWSAVLPSTPAPSCWIAACARHPAQRKTARVALTHAARAGMRKAWFAFFSLNLMRPHRKPPVCTGVLRVLALAIASCVNDHIEFQPLVDEWGRSIRHRQPPYLLPSPRSSFPVAAGE